MRGRGQELVVDHFVKILTKECMHATVVTYRKRCTDSVYTIAAKYECSGGDIQTMNLDFVENLSFALSGLKVFMALSSVIKRECGINRNF